MPRASTTQLREVSLQISRLIDQFSNSGEQYNAVIIALAATLATVDLLIENIEEETLQA